MRSRVLALSTVAAFLLATAYVPLLKAQEGPQSSSQDTVAKPRKKPDEAPPDEKKIPSEYKKQPQQEGPKEAPVFRSDSTTVAVDVAVLDDKGHFIPNIPRGNFRIMEDGVPQEVAGFGLGEAPMTICMVIEFSNRFQQYWSSGWYETLTASYGFLDTLKQEDAVAVAAFDLKLTILSDFSPDKRKAMEAMQRLRIPGFSESNTMDALSEIADRMSNIEGRKAILFIGSGLDTFSKLTFDKARKSLQESAVPIYSISILQIWRELMDAYGYMGPIARMDFLQADNQMRTFAKETGGQSYFPRFVGEFPSIFRAVADSMRNQYQITYHPSNTLRDGKYRKIKVELVNPANGEPLRIVNEKKKSIRYSVIAKPGYTAPREVE